MYNRQSIHNHKNMSEEIINTNPSTDVEVTAVTTDVTEMPVANPNDMTPAPIVDEEGIITTEEVAA